MCNRVEPYSSLERGSTSPDDNNLCYEGEGGREGEIIVRTNMISVLEMKPKECKTNEKNSNKY